MTHLVITLVVYIKYIYSLCPTFPEGERIKFLDVDLLH